MKEHRKWGGQGGREKRNINKLNGFTYKWNLKNKQTSSLESICRLLLMEKMLNDRTKDKETVGWTVGWDAVQREDKNNTGNSYKPTTPKGVYTLFNSSVPQEMFRESAENRTLWTLPHLPWAEDKLSNFIRYKRLLMENQLDNNDISDTNM